MPQIVGKYLRGIHARRFANTLHLRPDLTAAHRFSASGEKDLAGGNFLFSGVFQQLFTQLPRQQNRANFTLQRDSGAASPDSLHRDVPHLAHPDARGADGLHDEGDPLPAQAERGGDQLFVSANERMAAGRVATPRAMTRRAESGSSKMSSARRRPRSRRNSRPRSAKAES